MSEQMAPNDHYDGSVAVGGPSQTRVLPTALITKMAVGPYDNNSYLIECRRSGAALLIDAAAEPERLLPLVSDFEDLQILTTHAHPDHWQALGPVVTGTSARTLAGRLDAPEIPIPTDRLIDHGDILEVGDLRLRAIHLEGHTRGSIVVVLDDPAGSPHVFTGDCLFPGGIGRAIGEDNFESLYRGVVEKIFDRFGDETWIYPGHGDDTILGNERPHLAEWWARRW